LNRAWAAEAGVKRFAVYILPIVLWCVTIFVLSAQSHLPSVSVNHIDKLEHAAAYGVMGALFTRAFLGYGGKPRTALLLAIFFASAYGATDEIHQRFTPGRSPDVLDWAADTVGAALGSFCWLFIFVKRGEVVRR
jgi:VanZ family protein